MEGWARDYQRFRGHDSGSFKWGLSMKEGKTKKERKNERKTGRKRERKKKENKERQTDRGKKVRQRKQIFYSELVRQV